MNNECSHKKCIHCTTQCEYSIFALLKMDVTRVSEISKLYLKAYVHYVLTHPANREPVGYTQYRMQRSISTVQRVVHRNNVDLLIAEHEKWLSEQVPFNLVEVVNAVYKWKDLDGKKLTIRVNEDSGVRVVLGVEEETKQVYFIFSEKVGE